MSWRPWSKRDAIGLARYASREAANLLSLPTINRTDVVARGDLQQIVEAIYHELCDRGIQYAPEWYHPDENVQIVRDPASLLEAPREGTCLDLAALFCGVCLGFELLPFLVVLRGHALAAVSLRHGLRDWDAQSRTELVSVEDGPLTDAATLRTLVDNGSYLAIECTGFAQSRSLSGDMPEGAERDQGGLLSFARAVEAGRAQLDIPGRELQFALDIAVAHNHWRIEPFPLRPFGVTFARENYRRDRSDLLEMYGRVFVGRQNELTAIRQFARSQTPGYLLLQAPAGYGKSALVAELVSSGQRGVWPDGPMPDIVYFFIRQESAEATPEQFLRAVNSQLLELLGSQEPLGGAIGELRTQFTQLWAVAAQQARGDRPLLLLVDGSDEMTELGVWQLLPRLLTPYVHVVISARPTFDLSGVPRDHPLRAASTVRLDRFGAAEIEALLRGHGATEGMATIMADRVLRVTGGEPLYARFISEDVVRQGETALASVERRPPTDVTEYFEIQVDQLTASAGGTALAWDVLGLLTVAEDGLTTDELAELTGQPLRVVERAVEPIRRFLLPWRRLQLMHALFQDRVTSKFSRSERRNYEETLLAWGRSYRDAGWPADTPPYLLEHHTGQLARAGYDEELLDLVLDDRFRAVQYAGLGDVNATLHNLETALDRALRGRRWVPGLRCVAAYRASLRSKSSTEPIYARVDALEFDQARRRLKICSASPDWTRAIHLYVAWEAALAGDLSAARAAVVQARLLRAGMTGQLCDALLARTARAAGETKAVDPAQWLAEIHPERDANALLAAFAPPAPSTPAERAQLEAELDAEMGELHYRAARGDAEAASAFPLSERTEPPLGEEDTQYLAHRLKPLLLRLAAFPSGLQGIDTVLDVFGRNPYQRYRDISLVPVGVASAAIPDVAAARHRLRQILTAALDHEGVTFTFDLAAMLVGETHRRDIPATPAIQALAAYGEQARNQLDRWGTALRARSAQAAALFRQGCHDEAYRTLEVLQSQHSTYAGFATTTLLSIANRWLQFGRPDMVDAPGWGSAGGDLLSEAHRIASMVQDYRFNEQRRLMVEQYRDWLTAPEPDLAAAHAQIDELPDRELQLAYIDQLSARWSSPANPQPELVGALLVRILDDATTMDAVCARLVGMCLDDFDDQMLAEAAELCLTELATARPWELGAYG